MVADPLVGAAGFAAALRAAGVVDGVDATAGYLRALREIDLADREQVYWAGRVTLCRDPEHLPRYDLAFESWFGGPPVTATTPRGVRPRVARIAGLLPAAGPPGADGADGDPLAVAASETDVLRHRDIAELTAAERAQIAALLTGLRVHLPTRRALRWRRARSGPIDPRATLRRMVAAGGEPVAPRRRRRGVRPRRVVLLIDVSGSMRPYADTLLRFAHLLTHSRGANVEVFSLGTHMTRLTRAMRSRDPDTALSAAGATVPDWAGGTRLGETLGAFLTRHGRRGMARGATVVVFSDGWECGDPALLGTQLAQLRRLAHAVIWVNPHAGSKEYQPVQSGIAAALPHLDRLLAGHSVATLQELLLVMRDA